MYTKEQLEKYPYFKKMFEVTRLDGLLDPLTGVVSRAYIIGFAGSLIEAGTPFSFAILDLDNFKFINDTYGHQAGDGVLMNVGRELAEFLGDRGVAGRFGGDELLIINLKDIEYQEKKDFFIKMYSGEMVLRKNFHLDGCSPFVTATCGCATFPDDATDYDTLFSLIDKTLYRGKTKGRNCYIIYLEEKHKDIEIKKIARHGIYTGLHSLIRQFELVPGLVNKLHSVMPLLMEDLQISDLYYVGKNNMMHAVRNEKINEDVSDIARIMRDDVYTSNSLESAEKLAPKFCGAMKKLNVETLMVARIGMDMETDGYLICAEPRSHRIWQEDECALIYFLAKLLAARVRIDNEDIPE